jgi:NADPH:quinone reductase-like Zn-dependent oxidoreductase
VKAWELTGQGIDALAMAERPLPEPMPGEVVVRVRAVSLNYRDLAIARRGTVRAVVPVSDGSGEVVSVGEGVGQWSAGDRVITPFFRSWVDGPWHPKHAKQALGGAIDGVLAEEVALPADVLVGVPQGWSYEESATLPCAGVTAWNALTGGARRVGEGDLIVVQGTGGVSVFALQLAVHRGAQVAVISSSDAKLAVVSGLGAALGVNYRTVADWPAAVRERAERGADHVVEVTGQLEASLRAAASGATISIIGTTLAGTRVPVDAALIQQKVATVRGIFVGSATMLRALAHELAEAGIRPVIDKVFDFEDTPSAYQELSAASHVGKIVIRMS